MSRENTSFRAAFAASLVAVAILLGSGSLVSAAVAAGPGPSSDGQDVPPCVAKIESCAKGIEFTNEVVNVSNAEPLCCSEWSDVIMNDRKCVCDAFGSLITSSTNTTLFLQLCKINVSPDTLCQEGNLNSPPPTAVTPPAGYGPSASSATWAGPTSCFMLLLMTGLLLH